MSESVKQVLLRLPRSLHERLVAQSERDGVSVNTHLIRCLTEASAALEAEAEKRKKAAR